MFDQLDRQALLQITGMEIGKFTKRMEGIGYHVEVTDKAQEYVATKGYDVQFGARPLKRAIQTYIEDGICAHILDGSFEADKPIIIDRDGDSGELTFRQ